MNIFFFRSSIPDDRLRLFLDGCPYTHPIIFFLKLKIAFGIVHTSIYICYVFFSIILPFGFRPDSLDDTSWVVKTKLFIYIRLKYVFKNLCWFTKLKQFFLMQVRQWVSGYNQWLVYFIPTSRPQQNSWAPLNNKLNLVPHFLLLVVSVILNIRTFDFLIQRSSVQCFKRPKQHLLFFCILCILSSIHTYDKFDAINQFLLYPELNN